MEAKDNMTDTDQTMDGDEYPPDPPESDEKGPVTDESGPGTPPTPRAAHVRQKALQRKSPKSKRKSAGIGGQGRTRILSQQKRRQALELRKMGTTYNQIAEIVGYTDASAARKAVMKAMQEIIQEPVTELRTMQVERLNHMMLALWGKVHAGDESAINTALRIMDKMDSLMGTEQAQQVDVNVNQQNAILVIDGSKDDYIRSLRQMAGAGIQPDGSNPKALGPSQQQAPPGMGLPTGGTLHAPSDVVDGEVVEDGSLYDALGEEGREAIHKIMAPPSTDRVQPQADPTREVKQEGKKKFRFGVDPTVRRDKQ